ncbi:WD40 repeat domain-containing protein [Rhodopirellula sp. MGV]|uniref:WD40 repeat domain-containing protein n=1 Tax=Rhodopirellula sp. MGV TaxID=2023130 RepID=UPI00130419B5|nr:WD40 repeat domain-containing protein [Rhodopirellula sp. MGV]
MASLSIGGLVLHHTRFASADDAPTVKAVDASYRKETPVSLTVRLEPVSADFDGAIIQAIAVGPAGKTIAVAGDDHGIRILDVPNLHRHVLLTGHSDLIQSIQFDRTGRRLVSAGNDGELIVWNCRDWSIQQRMPTTHAFAGVRFSPDGKELAAVGFTDEVFIIGHAAENPHPRVLCDCTDLRSVEYRHDGEVLAVAGRSGKLHLFERQQYSLIGEYAIHNGRTHDMQFIGASPVLASVGEDGALTLFDTQSREVIRRTPVADGKLYAVCVIDQKFVAVAGSDDTISLVEMSTGTVVQRLTGHTGTITSLASVGTQLFSGGYDATLRKWQLDSIIGGADRIAERENVFDR